jgi:hypothetical protein
MCSREFRQSLSRDDMHVTMVSQYEMCVKRTRGSFSWRWCARPSAGCSKRPSSKAAADESTGGVASGYVEDAFEGRTKLADFFSILVS